MNVNGTDYYTVDEDNGVIYEIDKDEDVGDEIRRFNGGIGWRRGEFGAQMTRDAKT